MSPRLPLAVVASLPLLSCSALAQAPRVTAPEQHLGRPVASDFFLPDWNTVRGYFETLDRESSRVVVEKAGTTTEGRDLVLATISGERNLQRLDALKGIARQLSDPRGLTAAQRAHALAEGRPMVMISCAMHATECAGPQFAMRLAHELATSEEEPWKSAREELVVLLIPSTNPDGLDHVSEWYMRTVGTPYEATELTKLYQLYSGHDNNRDWFTLTQAETRIVSRLLYDEWRPQVYWDVHQQGSRQERMFVPPFRDPLNPNLDPGVIAMINLLGTRGQLDMTRAGLSGVATGGTYDMWWNGGNRNVPVRHNIVGILTEAASARLASPIFLARGDLRAPDGTSGYAPSNSFPDPWPGGWWRLADIVEYEMGFARSLFASLVRDRRLVLENALEAAERALKKGAEDVPQAWILPSDQDDGAATERLCDALMATGIEVEVAREAFEADGRSWPAGSVVIRRAQPYGQYVKDLFEVQRYPEAADAPYDVAGWSLPLILGVRRVEVVQPLTAKTQRVAKAADAIAAFRSEARTDRAAGAFDSRDGRGWKRAFELLRGGGALAFGTKGATEGLFVPGEPAQADKTLGGGVAIPRAPRIGLYSPWTGDMDEGWMRWVFDTFGVPYVTVRNEALRAGSIADWLDVLVLPGTSARELQGGRAEGSVFPEFASGLEPEGSAAVEAFVRGGGTLVAVGSSCRWAVEQLKLPLVDVTTEAEAKDFSCPGSVLRAIPEAGSAFTAGLPDTMAIFGSRPQAWRAMKDKERETAGAGAGSVDVLLRYAPTQLLLSGWIKNGNAIAGQPAWSRVRHGAGSVHVFGFRPQYRGWSQQSFQLLFRSMILPG